MPWAQFEEKQYEIAATVELGRRGDVFGPGQVFEKIVGYDAAVTASADHPIWRVLRVPRPPGLRLLPAHWDREAQPPADQLPTVVVSLILQYKRPEYLRYANAKQWNLWRRDYFRITRTAHQQRILLRLERSLGSSASVRYAAPAFWQRGELETAQLAGEVLWRSGYVRPSAFGSHTVWTYIQAGIDGRPNPSGPSRRFESLDQLLWEVQNDATALVPYDDFPRHLRALGEAAMDRNPNLRREVRAWLKTLHDRDLGLTPNQIGQLGDLAAIVTVTDRIGASWHLRAA